MVFGASEASTAFLASVFSIFLSSLSRGFYFSRFELPSNSMLFASSIESACFAVLVILVVFEAFGVSLHFQNFQSSQKL